MYNYLLLLFFFQYVFDEVRELGRIQKVEVEKCIFLVLSQGRGTWLGSWVSGACLAYPDCTPLLHGILKSKQLKLQPYFQPFYNIYDAVKV